MKRYAVLWMLLAIALVAALTLAACANDDDDDDDASDDDLTDDDDAADDDMGDDDIDDDDIDDDDIDDDDDAYSHTIVIDGNNDFTADETFASTTVDFSGYFSWDDSYLYYGMDGADIGGGSSDKWLLLYIGGSPGATTGVLYNTQQPTLPFSAAYHVRWKADGSYANAQQFDGWVDAVWDFTGDVFQSGNFIELRVPLADIGSPTQVDVLLCMVNEQSMSEWTYAGVPDTIFSDGFDPDYAHWLRFDLGASQSPADYTPL
ncbi:MAG: hypothetical protein P9M14_12425 [Candidatus Alcyoniella australis]|nr:hypothetical protein [Candidatus Alcyoniella australis]